MTVVQTDNGWAVIVNGGEVLVDGLASNADAWRWIDRYHGPVSAAEGRSADWFDRFIRG